MYAHITGFLNKNDISIYGIQKYMEKVRILSMRILPVPLLITLQPFSMLVGDQDVS